MKTELQIFSMSKFRLVALPFITAGFGMGRAKTTLIHLDGHSYYTEYQAPLNSYRTAYMRAMDRYIAVTD
jgi:hypothetical protein